VPLLVYSTVLGGVTLSCHINSHKKILMTLTSHSGKKILSNGAMEQEIKGVKPAIKQAKVKKEGIFIKYSLN